MDQALAFQPDEFQTTIDDMVDAAEAFIASNPMLENEGMKKLDEILRKLMHKVPVILRYGTDVEGKHFDAHDSLKYSLKTLHKLMGLGTSVLWSTHWEEKGRRFRYRANDNSMLFNIERSKATDLARGILWSWREILLMLLEQDESLAAGTMVDEISHILDKSPWGLEKIVNGGFDKENESVAHFSSEKLKVHEYLKSMIEDNPSWYGFFSKIKKHPSVSPHTRAIIDAMSLNETSPESLAIIMNSQIGVDQGIKADFLLAVDLVLAEEHRKYPPIAHIHHAFRLAVHLEDADRVASIWTGPYEPIPDTKIAIKAMIILIKTEEHREIAKHAFSLAFKKIISHLVYELHETLPGLKEGLKYLGPVRGQLALQGNSVEERRYYQQAIADWANEYLVVDEENLALKQAEKDRGSPCEGKNLHQRICVSEQIETFRKSMADNARDWDAIEIWDGFIKEARTQFHWIFVDFVGDELVKHLKVRNEGQGQLSHLSSYDELAESVQYVLNMKPYAPSSSIAPRAKRTKR